MPKAKSAVVVALPKLHYGSVLKCLVRFDIRLERPPDISKSEWEVHLAAKVSTGHQKGILPFLCNRVWNLCISDL